MKYLSNSGRGLFGANRGAGAIAQTVFARILAAAMMVATGVISARVLNVEGRGEMTAMLVWPTLLALLLTLGLPAAIRYWIRREPERRSEFFTVAVAGSVGASLVGIAIGVIFIPSWLHSYPASVIRGAQFLMIFSPEVILSLVYQAMLETLGDFKAANLARLLIVVFQLAGLLLLMPFHRLTPFSGAVVYCAAPVLIVVWQTWSLWSHLRLRRFDPRPAMRVLGSYGFRSYGIDVLNTIATQVDQVLVIAFLSASDVGIYVVGLNASRVINILHQSVVTVVFPSAAGLEKERVVEMVERSARVSTGIALLFGAALVLALPVLVPLFYGGPFAAAIPVAQLLTLEAVLGGLVSVLAQAFMALGRPGFVTILQGLGLAAVLPLMFVLLPHYGLIGAAVALLLSTTLRLVIIAVSYPAILRVPFPKLIPIWSDFRQLRIALVGR